MGPDPRGLFVESVAALARRLDQVDLVLADLSGFTLDGVLVSGEAFRIRLDNLWAAVQTLAGAERADEIERQTRAMFAPRTRPAAWSDVEDRLVPTLRSAASFAGMEVVARSALPHLVEALALDLPDSVAYVTAEQLRGWGRTADEGFAAARATSSAAPTMA